MNLEISIPLTAIFIVIFIVNIIIINLFNWWARVIQNINSDETSLFGITYVIYIVINIGIIVKVLT